MRWSVQVAECPFCGSTVTEDLVVYGGTCPKCFAEIPGEEAATDPGEEVKARQEWWDRFRARVPMVLGMLFLLVIVGCTGITALVTLVWPDPEVAEILDFDLLDYPMPDLVGAEGADAAPDRDPEPDQVAEAPDPRPSGGARPRPRSVPKPPPPRPTGRVNLSMDMPQVRRDDNVVLSDPDAIRDMIGERMVEFIPGLKICYDRRLKVAPSLKGRWKLKFVVAPTGAVTEVGAEGMDRRDTELERCLVDHIADHWRFGKISIAQPVQRTLRFFPN